MQSTLEAVNIILKVRGPEKSNYQKVKLNHHIISFIWPNQNKTLLEALKKKKVAAQAMDMIPRISRAQKWTLYLLWLTAGYEQ